MGWGTEDAAGAEGQEKEDEVVVVELDDILGDLLIVQHGQVV